MYESVLRTYRVQYMCTIKCHHGNLDAGPPTPQPPVTLTCFKQHRMIRNEVTEY